VNEKLRVGGHFEISLPRNFCNFPVKRLDDPDRPGQGPIVIGALFQKQPLPHNALSEMNETLIEAAWN